MNFNNYTLIEIIESFAEENGFGFSSEEQLSEAFDESIAPMVIEQYGADDTVAMNEAFSDWTDSLCKDGELHPEQYNTYCYVGQYADED